MDLQEEPGEDWKSGVIFFSQKSECDFGGTEKRLVLRDKVILQPVEHCLLPSPRAQELTSAVSSADGDKEPQRHHAAGVNLPG